MHKRALNYKTDPAYAPAFDGDWLMTYSGVDFPVVRPAGGWGPYLRLEDIAHAQSQICRYVGHTRVFYSVAEHSVLVALRTLQIAAELGIRGDDLLRVGRGGLGHDFTEAYIMDVPSPLKRAPMFAGYKEHEASLHADIADHYDFRLTAVEERIVKLADMEMLAVEARDVMGPCRRQWLLPTPTIKGEGSWEFQPDTKAVLGEFKAGTMTPEQAKAAVLAMAERLGMRD